jgi:hypothetical protein
MASTTQEQLYETFAAIEWGGAAPEEMIHASEELASSVTDAAKTIEAVGTTWTRISPVFEASTVASPTVGTAASTGNSISAATSGVLQTFLNMSPAGSLISEAAQATGVGGGGGILGSIGSALLKGGSGLFGLVGSLFGLFGGGDSEAPPALMKYSLPPAIAFEGLDTPSGVRMSDYNMSGVARAYGGADLVTSSTARDGSAASGAAPPQITVNIQAMDARSFLDRSSDIAAAVRDAMLNLNSINDVVNDL